ncbi:MAG: hypothetical protein IJG08_07425, partial [Oscillospiraceae bacterium]|nr:hypothetical protein [Oscillospiraceae bacterium]
TTDSPDRFHMGKSCCGTGHGLDAVPYIEMLRIRRTWPTCHRCCCRGVGTPPPTIKSCGFAGLGRLPSVLLAKRGGRPKKDPLNF